jgi:hypothetical protein
MSTEKFVRPSLEAALKDWGKSLASHNLPAEPLWIFAENLCIEHSRTTPESFNVGFQTKFSPPDVDALEIAYDQFSATEARIVFYRLGSAGNKSICILLCDPWFEEKSPRDGFERRDDWKISFRPGHAGEIEEVTDLKRWVRRIRRDRAFHDFDFSMSLETVDEIKLHGRTLAPYERMGQKMLNRLRTVLGQE